jgi:hypothetical protein
MVLAKSGAITALSKHVSQHGALSYQSSPRVQGHTTGYTRLVVHDWLYTLCNLDKAFNIPYEGCLITNQNLLERMRTLQGIITEQSVKIRIRTYRLS